ncbi:class I SAM-dependent methyltransferase [Clostridiaceae bacterium]|nr:class I SAM-dependent methyltransferase [Clostridiaceae bacterium]RKI11501.1 class I SAM-dependent methyltransferase [bacterium 1XD21-70]
MKFTEEDYEYLRGEKFSSGYHLKLKNNAGFSRQELLINLVQGKNCIHVGCCDHIALIQDKAANRNWLHGELENCCTDVLGIDINQQAVDFVNEKGFSKRRVYCADVTSPDFLKKVPHKNYDYILLGEIIEHVDNPVWFLAKMRTVLNEYGFMGKYIITVPNAFCFLKTSVYQEGIEFINSDHRYWFTPYTIAKIMIEAKIVPEELFFANYGRMGNEDIEKSYQGDQIVIMGH